MYLSHQWSLQGGFSPRSSHLKQLSSQRVLSETATTGNSSKAATALVTSAVKPLPASSRNMRSAMKHVPISRSALPLALVLTGFLGSQAYCADVLSIGDGDTITVREQGTKVKVDTRTGEYLGRVSDE